MPQDFYSRFYELYSTGIPCVSVTLVDVVGSAPQKPGAKMLVTEVGLTAGTVGGGKIENRCLEEAAAMLTEPGGPASRFAEWNLQKDIGMTCGGVVRVHFESFHKNPWDIVVFGAGHVAQALIRILTAWDCRITCIDPRSDWLLKLPESPRLRGIQSALMPGEVKSIPKGAFVLLITMGHSTDSPILVELLKAGGFPYIGVIGSTTKAGRLKMDIRQAGLAVECESAFFCPVGLQIGSRDPAEIAVSIAAQLLQERDRRANAPS